MFIAYWELNTRLTDPVKNNTDNKLYVLINELIIFGLRLIYRVIAKSLGSSMYCLTQAAQASTRRGGFNTVYAKTTFIAFKCKIENWQALHDSQWD